MGSELLRIAEGLRGLAKAEGGSKTAEKAQNQDAKKHNRKHIRSSPPRWRASVR
ncbi:MAG: hypothetical protein K2O91_10470 [Lachnospiraceae bacterium]|nr:hypothetical protein [Lachnospiraceae bacterium]